MDTRQLLYVEPTQNYGVPISEITASGWNVEKATDSNTARGMIGKSNFHVGLLVVEPELDQIQLCSDLCAQSGHMNWIALLPEERRLDDGIGRLIGNSFYDYHTLPADTDRLLATLGHAYGMAVLKDDGQDIEADDGLEEEMVGSSPPMLALFQSIRKVAGVDAPVLVTGESGTGKELAAHAIHERSNRANGPFVAVNCGAIPASLIQSELFGYEKGAFTGAVQRKIGRIEAAAGGTIFLDEIGDLPLDMQVNLLRFLQESTIERVGSTQSINVDVRVIAATHVDLVQAVQAGRFREDLYYRLHVLDVKVPPLRERVGDIELLAHFFFRKFSGDKRPGLDGFGSLAIHAMQTHEWPGNVREMINRVRRAMVMGEHRMISPADLGLESGQIKRNLMPLAEVRAAAERDAIAYALQRADNNVSLAADYLGVSRVTLYRLMKKMELGS